MICKKNLYKSTYKENAFIKGKDYKVLEEDEEFFWMKDENGNKFNFSKEYKFPYYHIEEYFLK